MSLNIFGSINKKQIATLATLLLISTTILSLTILPSSAAASKQTYAIIGASPNPIGVGQLTTIAVGITDGTQATADGWHGLTVTVTKPDGNIETLGPFTTDSTGATGTSYTPTIAGNYTLQTHFPAQWYNYSAFTMMGFVSSNVYYEASDSEILTLTVTENPRPYYPDIALPTEYWTRPIDAQARSWYSISASWLATSDMNSLINSPNLYAPYNNGPESSHILWTKPIDLGGLVGGGLALATSENEGAVGYGTGDAYEGKWSTRFIISGRLYYTEGGASMMGARQTPVVYHCVDLHTGEEIWAKTFMDNKTISFGQLFYYQTYNYQGTFAYLWVTTGGPAAFGPATAWNWYAFDAFTGNQVFTVKNVPIGTLMQDANGGYYSLVTDTAHGWMALWNMTALVPGGSWGNSVIGQTFDAAAPLAKSAYTSNITIPAGLSGSVKTAFFDDRVIGSNIGNPSLSGAAQAPAQVVMWGLSLKQGSEGQVLFKETWNAPNDWINGNQTLAWVRASKDDEIGILFSKEQRQYYGVDLTTGKLKWGPTASQSYLDAYDAWTNSQTFTAYGNLYSASVSGIVHCYDIKTGTLQWKYAVNDPYTESILSSNWWVHPVFITDGKIYLGAQEHSPNQPLPRGAPFVCLNASTGEVVWRADGIFRSTLWGGQAIIGDSIIATMDTYDQRIYAVGKGPTAMTVSTPDTAVPLGTTVVIKGTITDNSPGTASAALTIRFPNGVAAVSDESMNNWMLYVYKQFSRPTNTTGVPIKLSVIDSNGNYRIVGTTTSNDDGFFTFNWTPDIQGPYTLYASFEGSKSYYASHAVSSFAVDEAVATVTPQPTQAPSAADLYFIPAIVGVIIAIVVVGALLALLVTKKP